MEVNCEGSLWENGDITTGEQVSSDERARRWLENYRDFGNRKPRFQFWFCHLMPNNVGQVIYPIFIDEKIMTERFVVVQLAFQTESNSILQEVDKCYICTYTQYTHIHK